MWSEWTLDKIVKNEYIRLGVLKDILTKNRNEVVDMILTTFNQELHDKTERESTYAEGETKALISIIRRKMNSGLSPVALAEDLGLDAGFVTSAVSLLKKDNTKSDLQIAKLLLQKR